MIRGPVTFSFLSQMLEKMGPNALKVKKILFRLQQHNVSELETVN